MTKKEAAMKWVSEFDRIPEGILEKLLSYDPESVREVTPETESESEYELPVWGTLWSFRDPMDEEWLAGNMEKMAKCGFRIFEQEDYGYIFGIDGGGYDFYEVHWIPLYEARGLNWHD